MLWLAENHCVVAQNAASRNLKGGLGIRIVLRDLPPGAHVRFQGGAVLALQVLLAVSSNRAKTVALALQSHENSSLKAILDSQ